MSPTTEDTQELLDLFQDDSPARYLVQAATERPDEPEIAMQEIVNSWVLEAHEEEAQS